MNVNAKQSFRSCDILQPFTDNKGGKTKGISTSTHPYTCISYFISFTYARYWGKHIPVADPGGGEGDKRGVCPPNKPTQNRNLIIVEQIAMCNAPLKRVGLYIH